MGLLKRIANKILTPTTELPLIQLDQPRQQTLLNDYSSLFSIAYMACEQTKARSIGSLPFGVYRRGDGTRERVDHPLTDLLNGQANDLMSGRDLRHWLMLRRDTLGDAYIFVEWRRGAPVGLWPVTSYVQIDFDKEARAGKRVRYIISGDDFVPDGTYFADEVLHFRTSLTKDGVQGQSIARLAAHEIGLSIDLEKFYSSMLNNGNHQLGHLEVPNGRMKDEDLDAIKTNLRKMAGVERAGEAPIFGYGAKWVNDTQSMKDASVIEQQTWVLQQICRACNVPPWMVYDSSSGNGKYENAEASRVDYVTGTLMPDTTDFEGGFNSLLRATGAQDLYTKFDLNGLMRGDKAAQGQFYRDMIFSMTYSPNEVRAYEDLNPVPGLDRYLVPLNYGLMEKDGTVTFITADAKYPANGSQTGVVE